MVGNVLFIIIDAPVTNDTLKQAFSVYELTHLPLPTPETDRFYSLLSTEIKYIGFNRDSEIIIQIRDGQNLPTPDVWLLTDVPALFFDRAKSTCASALIAGDLTDIKALCRYAIPPWNYSLI